jgi:UDP-GlcNAc:undecaprenyl-phosphate GlcNAc-1-phosphate transferase
MVVAGSALVSGVVVAASIRLAHRVDAYDHPDGGRKLQAIPIPKLGGLAVSLAFSACTLGVLAITHRPGDLPLAMAALLPALGGAVVGYLDDRRNLNPYLRLALQGALALFAWALGNRLAVTGNQLLDGLLIVIWIVIIVNGINLLDNSDGLAGTTVLVSALGASVIGLMFGQQLVSLLGFALVGVCIGYLWHNWYPATVYMGDSGAYFLGFLLAILVTRLRPDTLPPLIAIVVAVLLALLPLIDVPYVVVKRLRAGVHPFTAGRDHLSHVLQGRGASVPASVLLLQLILVAGVLAAIALVAVLQ